MSTFSHVVSHTPAMHSPLTILSRLTTALVELPNHPTKQTLKTHLSGHQKQSRNARSSSNQPLRNVRLNLQQIVRDIGLANLDRAVTPTYWWTPDTMLNRSLTHCTTPRCSSSATARCEARSLARRSPRIAGPQLQTPKTLLAIGNH